MNRFKKINTNTVTKLLLGTATAIALVAGFSGFSFAKTVVVPKISGGAGGIMAAVSLKENTKAVWTNPKTITISGLFGELGELNGSYTAVNDTGTTYIKGGAGGCDQSNIFAPEANSALIDLHLAYKSAGSNGDCVAIPKVTVTAAASKGAILDSINNTGSAVSSNSENAVKSQAKAKADANADADKADCTDPHNSNDPACSLTKQIIVPIINLLSMAVGLIVVLSIIIAGIMYITANGNSQQVEVAKSRIVNSLWALVVYIFGSALLQWLIPGGLFH